MRRKSRRFGYSLSPLYSRRVKLEGKIAECGMPEVPEIAGDDMQ
jgi:hypothetical protein